MSCPSTILVSFTALLFSAGTLAAQTWTTSQIQRARQGLAATTVGHLALFAGGDDGTQRNVEVNIYDSSTGTWTISALSEARAALCATSVGDVALFAGGLPLSFNASDTVDLYDAKAGKWLPPAKLARPRIGPAAASVGGYALIAGGGDGPNPGTPSDVVDIYGSRTGTWAQTKLSVPRRDLAATAVGPYALFAGGSPGGPFNSSVDVYDSTVGPPTDPTAWSQSSLSQARIDLAATTAGPRAYFAGGIDATFNYSDVVDIYDSTLGPPSDPAAWSVERLSVPRIGIAATSQGDVALFAGGWHNFPFTFHAMVEVFDGATRTWSMETLSVARRSPAATTAGNQALFAGGQAAGGGFGAPSGVVDIRTTTQNCAPDLGSQGPGAASATLCGSGLNTGESSDYDVICAPANAVGALFISANGFPDVSVLGGTLVSFGGFAVHAPLVASPTGTASLTFNGLGTAVDLVFQSAFLDGSAPGGVAFTNAVLAQFGK